MTALYSSVRLDSTRNARALAMIDTQLKAHPAWTYVDTVLSPGGRACNVYRCRRDINPAGIDWYFLVANPNDSTLMFAFSEGYSNGQVSYPAPGTNAATVPPAADYSYGAGVLYPIWTPVSTTNADKNMPNQKDLFWTPSGPYSGSYLNDGDVVYMVTAATGVWIWWGQRGSSSCLQFGASTIETFDPTNPQLVIGGELQNNNGVAATRHPKLEPGVVRANAWRFFAPNRPEAQWTPTMGALNAAGDHFWKDRPVASRRVVRSYGSASQPEIYGGFYGLFPQILQIATFSGSTYSDSVNSGDTTLVPRMDGTLDNDTYAYMYRFGGSGCLWVNLSQS